MQTRMRAIVATVAVMPKSDIVLSAVITRNASSGSEYGTAHSFVRGLTEMAFLGARSGILATSATAKAASVANAKACDGAAAAVLVALPTLYA